jgi:hypothetical protein
MPGLRTHSDFRLSKIGGEIKKKSVRKIATFFTIFYSVFSIVKLLCGNVPDEDSC